MVRKTFNLDTKNISISLIFHLLREVEFQEFQFRFLFRGLRKCHFSKPKKMTCANCWLWFALCVIYYGISLSSTSLVVYSLRPKPLAKQRSSSRSNLKVRHQGQVQLSKKFTPLTCVFTPPTCTFTPITCSHLHSHLHTHSHL